MPFPLRFNRSSRSVCRLWLPTWLLKFGMAICPWRLMILSMSCNDRWKILLGVLATTVRRWRWAGGFNGPWKRWETPDLPLIPFTTAAGGSCHLSLSYPSISSGVMRQALRLPGWEGSPLSAAAPTPSQFSTSSLRNLCGLRFLSRRSGSVRSQSWLSGSMVRQRPQQSTSSTFNSQFIQIM